ncbi:MAG TPA: S41 family peptidase [Chryseosolibacter sp.]
MRKVVIKRLQTKLPSGKFDNRKIVEDVNYYISTVEKIVPFPYLYTKKSKIDSIASGIKEKTALTPLQFYEHFLRLQGAYNVGHMYCEFPHNNYHRFVENGGGILPFKCVLDDDSVSVTSTLKPGMVLLDGDRVLSINGLRADSLYNVFCGYEGGLRALKIRRVSRSFAEYLWLNGINPPFQIKFARGGSISSCMLEGYRPKVNAPPFKALKQVNPGNLGDIISYSVVQDTIAYIDFKSMQSVNSNRFNEFLATTFQDIKTRKIGMLVIDLRRNSGGNSIHGATLINYFNSRPYRMTANKKWLVSREYKANYKRMFPWYVRGLAVTMTRKAYFKHQEGTFFKYKNPSSPIEPAPNENRFTGKVYVLIANRTFSSAMMMANAVKDYSLATVVGEPSGDAPNHLGEIVAVRLPNSGISCWLPSALFIRANGDQEDNNPVVPDIVIKNVDKMEVSDLLGQLRGVPQQ